MKKFAVVGKKYFWLVGTTQEIDEIKGGEIAAGIISLEDLECPGPSGIELILGFYWKSTRHDIKEIGKLKRKNAKLLKSKGRTLLGLIVYKRPGDKRKERK